MRPESARPTRPWLLVLGAGARAAGCAGTRRGLTALGVALLAAACTSSQGSPHQDGAASGPRVDGQLVLIVPAGLRAPLQPQLVHVRVEAGDSAEVAGDLMLAISPNVERP